MSNDRPTRLISQPLSVPVRMYRKSTCTNVLKSYCTTSGIGGSIGISKMLKLYVKVPYVMGKGLSGELSCERTGRFEEYPEIIFLFLNKSYVVTFY